MKSRIVLIALMFMSLSCNKNKIYDDFDSNFDNKHQDSSDIRDFDFDNTQYEGVSELILHLGHIGGFQFKEVP